MWQKKFSRKGSNSLAWWEKKEDTHLIPFPSLIFSLWSPLTCSVWRALKHQKKFDCVSNCFFLVTMEDDTRAIVVGLGAGLGGFAGLVSSASFFSPHVWRIESSFIAVDCWLCLLADLVWLVSASNDRVLRWYLYFSWCEKKPASKPVKPIPLKNQRRIGTTTTLSTKTPSTVATVASARNAYPDFVFDSSHDLASKVKSARR